MTGSESLRLVLDIQNLQTEQHSERGIARYITSHVRELLRSGPSIHSLWLNHSRPFPKAIDPEILYSKRLRWADPGALLDFPPGTTPAYWITSPMEAAPFETLLPQVVTARRLPLIVTLYDLIPFIHPELYLPDEAARLAYSTGLELLRLADVILAISDSARNDAVRLLGLSPDKIAVIHAGVSPFFSPAASKETDRTILSHLLPDLQTGFIYTVLGEDARKNLDGLLAAFDLLPARLRTRYQLVIGGSYRAATIENILARIPERTRSQVLFTNYLPDPALRALYRCCALFVFPSIYEGFGLPVAEAVACGALAVTSNTSSLPEIIDSPEATFDPHAPSAIAACIAAALDDPARRDRIRAAGLGRIDEFRWERVAAKSLDAIARILPPPPSRPRSRRLSIGLAGPFSRESSGIAGYNLRIATELARIASVHLFYTDGSDPVALQSAGAVECHPISSIGRSVWPQYLDHIIYTIANHPDHVESCLAFQRVPGVLWLHEAHLADLYRAVAGRLHPAGAAAWLAGSARAMYGIREHRCPALLDPAAFTPQAARDWSVHMTRDLAALAHGIIFHSTAAREIVLLDLNAPSDLPRHFILPLAAPDSVHTPASHNAHPAAGAFASVEPGQSPDLLIEAAALLAPHTSFTLTFAGEGDPAYLQTLRHQAQQLGLQDRVHFTGAGPSECRRLFAEATSTCAVQLRGRCQGESSAAVLDSMAHGVPVITNLAACLDMPPGTVLQLPFDPTAAQLAAALASLFGDPVLRHGLRDRALQYAGEHSYPRTARTLLESLPALASGIPR